jgi:excisionase family DNA binding protein
VDSVIQCVQIRLEAADRKDKMQNRKLLTVDEAAGELALKPKTLRQKIWRREIEYLKIGGAIRIRADVIAQIIEQSTVPALEAR